MTHPVVVGIRGKEENQDQKSLDVNVFSMERTGRERGDLGPGGIKKEMNMGGGIRENLGDYTGSNGELNKYREG